LVDCSTLYARVGGRAFFEGLVDRFYEEVSGDPTLRPMYPDDLAPSREHLTSFLIQYWGGPADYSRERGHPRLRIRHAPFPITAEAADAWLAHMRSALAGADGLDGADADELDAYFAMASRQLRNV
jgi:hemoglobin